LISKHWQRTTGSFLTSSRKYPRCQSPDPGWTPLFVNASAVILEVGGMLQHGALVAREYGLPCVTGVENATTRWQDGTLVEVDGSQGMIRMIANKTTS
jgi:rifampicin phosphotransferase